MVVCAVRSVSAAAVRAGPDGDEAAGELGAPPVHVVLGETVFELSGESGSEAEQRVREQAFPLATLPLRARPGRIAEAGVQGTRGKRQVSEPVQVLFAPGDRVLRGFIQRPVILPRPGDYVLQGQIGRTDQILLRLLALPPEHLLDLPKHLHQAGSGPIVKRALRAETAKSESSSRPALAGRLPAVGVLRLIARLFSAMRVGRLPRGKGRVREGTYRDVPSAAPRQDSRATGLGVQGERGLNCAQKGHGPYLQILLSAA